MVNFIYISKYYVVSAILVAGNMFLFHFNGTAEVNFILKRVVVLKVRMHVRTKHGS